MHDGQAMTTAMTLIEGGSVTVKIITFGSILALLALFALFTLTPLVASRPVASACSASSAVKYQRLTDLAGGTGAGGAVAFNADGSLMASAGSGNALHVWETVGFTAKAGWEHNEQATENINTVEFSADGKYLATGSSDKTATVYEVASGKQVLRIKHMYDVRRVVFSADSKWFASAGWDGSIQVVRLSATQLNFKWWMQPTVDSGIKLLVTDIALAPDGRWLASLSQGSRGPSVLHVWDMKTGRGYPQLQWELAVYSNVLFSPDGRWMIAGTGSGAPITVWEVGTWKVIAELPTKEAFNRIAISPDGRYVAYSEGVSENGTLKGKVRVWRTDTWKMLNEFALDDVVWDVQFSPDSTEIAVAVGQPQLQADGVNLGLHEAQLRDTQTGALIVRLPQEPNDEVLSATFSPDGCRLVLGTQNGITVWQVK